MNQKLNTNKDFGNLSLMILKSNLYLRYYLLKDYLFSEETFQYESDMEDWETMNDTEKSYNKKPKEPDNNDYRESFLNLTYCTILEFWEEYDTKRKCNCVFVTYMTSSPIKATFSCVMKTNIKEFISMLETIEPFIDSFKKQKENDSQDNTSGEREGNTKRNFLNSGNSHTNN